MELGKLFYELCASVSLWLYHPQRYWKKQCELFLLCGAVFLLVSCSAQPPESMIREVITKYFESKGYAVVDISIAETKPVPLGEKKYMGTEGYTVEIKSITLEIAGKGAESKIYKKGERLTFSGGTVRLREKPGEKGKWEITHISGIPVI